jgi:ABC-type bacteriocin/lantibiotic exporter with double-glycine peptidase domain
MRQEPPLAQAGPEPARGRVNLRAAWQAWRHVWKANRVHLRELLAAGLLINLLGLALPLFSAIVYDKIMGNGATASLWALAIGMGIAVSLEAVLRQVRVVVVEHVGARWDRTLDLRVFHGALQAPLANPPEVGPVLSRYRDVMGSRDFLSATFLLPVADLPFILLFLLAILMLGGPMMLVALLFGLALLAVSYAAHHMARRFQARFIRDTNAKVSLLVESLSALETLRRPAAAARAASRFAALAQSSAADGAASRVWHASAMSLAPALSTLSTVGTMVLGVYLVEAQAMTTGQLLACSMLVSRCVMLFGSTATLANRYRDFVQAVSELGELVQLADGRVLKPRRARLAPLPTPDFVLSRVAFRREGADRSVLEDVSMHIPPGQFVALVGRAGSGKSTLLRLLAGRLVTTGGALMAGGVPVTAKNAPWLAGHVGYKAQDPQFLGMTVGELLADSGERATPAERLAMLRRVGLGRALDAGELSLATRLGPQGNGVSGGQRQMLALACALLQGEQVLLLDEPTLGLDSGALQEVLQLLARLKGQRTIVVATHATELIGLADRLVLVGEGKVLADGPREKLLVKEAPPQAA